MEGGQAAASGKLGLFGDARGAARDRGRSIVWLIWHYFWNNWFLGNLVRVRHTAEQAGKSRAARMRDLAGAFAVRRREAIAGRTVLLIDDVMTTASTADACARALRAMDEPAGSRGADEVWVAVAARVR